MDLYQVSDYRRFLQHLIYEREQKWGLVKEVAKAVQCHSSYVSQVCQQKAHFSPEQAFLVAEFFKLSTDETDFLIELLNYNRAAAPKARQFFKARLEKRRKERLDLTKRFKETTALSNDEIEIYYDSWVPQALHMLCMIEKKEWTSAALAKALGISERRVQTHLEELLQIGVLVLDRNQYKVQRPNVHAPKGSRAAQRLHQNWRAKTLGQLDSASDGDNFHYSAVMTMTSSDARKIHEQIRSHLESVRETVLPSPSESVYVHLIDFYPLPEKP
jgi:uncharacterized protein (TIGR02147 family)